MGALRPVLSSPLRSVLRSPFGGSEAEIITADTLPVLAALTDAQTPADGFASGTYSSSAGTISSETAVYYVDGSPQAGTYDLAAGEVVRVREDVEDSEGNTRSFWTAAVVVAPVTAIGVESVSEVGTPTATILAPAAVGVESVSEVGAPVFIVPAAIGVESYSVVGVPELIEAATLTLPVDEASGPDTADVWVTTDKSFGTLYWVLDDSATEPSAAQIVAGNGFDGAAAVQDGSVSVTAAGQQAPVPISGLDPLTSYYAHFVHDIGGAVYSNIASGDGFTTEASGDTTPPVMTNDNYDEGSTTFSADLDEDAVLHVLVSDTQPTTANDIILGTGLLKFTDTVSVGSNTNPWEFSAVPEGTHWLGIQPVDLAGNSDFAQAHVQQYVFPGPYVAVGVESASEVGTASVAGTATPALGVESASEVGAPTATINAPAATGVESASQIGSATVSSIQAPAATGVQSTSEVGEPDPPAAGSTLPDDDFNDGTIDVGWTQWLPASENSDLSFAEGSGAVTLTIGNTYSHDPYGAAEPETAVLKQDIAIGTGDFEIIAQFTNEPTATLQGHGIYLEDGDGDWQRHDVGYSSGLKGFAATWTGSNMSNKIASTSVSHWAYLRVSRTSGTTHFYVSSNGTDWTEVGSGFSDARSWTKAGIYGMRDGAAGSFNAVCTDFAYT